MHRSALVCTSCTRAMSCLLSSLSLRQCAHLHAHLTRRIRSAQGGRLVRAHTVSFVSRSTTASQLSDLYCCFGSLQQVRRTCSSGSTACGNTNDPVAKDNSDDNDRGNDSTAGTATSETTQADVATSGSSSAATKTQPRAIRVRVTDREGVAHDLCCQPGMTLMEVIRDVGKLDMEAACDGTCACSTCHVIFTPESYKRLSSAATEDEMDMLDLAPSVTQTSRLSCQVQLTADMDGVEVRIPDEMENQMR